MKTVSELCNELQMLEEEGMGEAIVYVDTDVTVGIAPVAEVFCESSEKVVLR